MLCFVKNKYDVVFYTCDLNTCAISLFGKLCENKKEISIQNFSFSRSFSIIIRSLIFIILSNLQTITKPGSCCWYMANGYWFHWRKKKYLFTIIYLFFLQKYLLESASFFFLFFKFFEIKLFHEAWESSWYLFLFVHKFLDESVIMQGLILS